MDEYQVSRVGDNGGFYRVQGLPVTVHQGIVQLLTLLHEMLVPLLHVAFRDGFWNKTKQIKLALVCISS